MQSILPDFVALLKQADKLRQQGPRGRYAPSPTGAQHFGNARTALLAWLQTRLQHGVFIMRMEDLDRPREVPGSANQIVEELEWMGLDWDDGGTSGGASPPYLQSQRDDYYAAALTLLRQNDRVFQCTCSRKDIRNAASAPHSPGPVYPGTCRGAGRIAAGRRHTWRCKVPNERIGFVDEIAGPFEQDMMHDAGDFVVKRSDQIYAYQLAVVVDDALMGISDVVRGVDLLDSTPRQILLYRALGAPQPNYWHVPLMLDDQGRRMSKRFGSPTIADFRAGGGTPRRLVGQLASSLGLVDRGSELAPADLLQMYDLDSFRRCLQAVSSGPEPIAKSFESGA